jgi:hypothetical protein
MTNEIEKAVQSVEIITKDYVPPPLPRVEANKLDLAAVLQAALTAGRPIAELQAAMDLYERLEMIRRVAAYNTALAEFKRRCPRIIRRTDNAQFKVTRNGVKRDSRFASLSDISEAIDGVLGEVGLSYGWTDADTKTEPGKMIIGCIVTHAEGYVATPKYVTFPMDTAGAGSSPQQKTGSVASYGMRYSLKIALGLTDVDDDDIDGNEPSGAVGLISEDQARTINDLLIELDGERRAAKKLPVDRERFCAKFKVKVIAELPSNMFETVVAAIDEQRKAARA